MTIADFPRYHDHATRALVRPPGTPEGECRGALHRVSPDGGRIDPRSSPVLDDCQAGEGAIGQSCEVTLWRCSMCGATLVVARCPDWSLRLRNEHGAAAAAV